MCVRVSGNKYLRTPLKFTQLVCGMVSHIDSKSTGELLLGMSNSGFFHCVIIFTSFSCTKGQALQIPVWPYFRFHWFGVKMCDKVLVVLNADNVVGSNHLSTEEGCRWGVT